MKAYFERRRAFCFAGAMLLALFCCRVALAVQQYDVRNGERITVHISADALTRIAMVSGRIDDYWDDNESLLVEADPEHGALFVRPARKNHKGTISLFVRDAAGRTYNLVATAKDIEAESILLRPSGVQMPAAQSLRAAALPHVRSIKRLVKAMARSRALSHYTITDTGEHRRLWEEVHLVSLQQYQGVRLFGEVYELTNGSKAQLVITESELTQLSASVLAVAIESTELSPGESTRVYVVHRGAQP
jgi:hypothetical protein